MGRPAKRLACHRNIFRYYHRPTNRGMEMSHLAEPLKVPNTELEAAVDTVVGLCDGDQRAALRALVAAQH